MTKTTTPSSRVFATLALLLLSLPATALANTAPSPLILSAAMRPGTTYMDVVFRVNDPDDATVKVRALAFVDGVRSFAKVLRPVTFVEGTAAKIGDAITSNTNHTLTWDVGADWNIDLGQVKFEILARDARGLLAFEWITIPAAGSHPALTISKDAPSDASVLSALFWQYAEGDSWLTLTNGLLTGNVGSGIFESEVLANGNTLQLYSVPYILKRMSLDPASASEVNYAVVNARAGLLATNKWHTANRAYAGTSKVIPSGYNGDGIITIPTGLTHTVAVSAGQYISLALQNDGTVVAWGNPSYINVPTGLTGVTAISAGNAHSLALKSDGTVVAWGNNADGQSTVPAGLGGVVAVAAGGAQSMALKSDGSVVTWGTFYENGGTPVPMPPGLAGVTAISAGTYHNLALKNDGTVVGWGNNTAGQLTLPAGLTGVVAIAAGFSHSVALKSDGTVVAWGDGGAAETSIPAGLNGVTAIAAGAQHSLALKNDGTVVKIGIGSSQGGAFLPFPDGLTGITAVAAGVWHDLVLKPQAQ